jgi:hypothetical protein
LARICRRLTTVGERMTGDQWLLFVGLPAFFAVILLIADYVRSRRRRSGMTISTTLLDEKTECPSAYDARETKPVSSPAAGAPRSLAELERLIRAKRPN